MCHLSKTVSDNMLYVLEAPNSGASINSEPEKKKEQKVVHVHQYFNTYEMPKPDFNNNA